MQICLQIILPISECDGGVETRRERSRPWYYNIGGWDGGSRNLFRI